MMNILDLILLTHAFSFASGSLRLLRIINLNHFFLACFIIIQSVLLLINIYTGNFMNMTLFEFLLFLYPIILIPVSILNGNIPQKIIVDVLWPVLFVSTVVYFKNYKKEILHKDRLIFFVINLIFLAGLINILLITYKFLSSRNIYPSSSDIIFVIPFLYFLIDRKYIFSSISLILLFLGGKRGPLVSALISLFIYLISSFIYSVKKKTFKIKQVFLSSIIICAILFISVNLVNTKYLRYIPTFAKIPTKFTMEEVSRYVGGRVQEIVCSLKPFRETPLLLITGKGPGYTYEYSFLGTYEPHKHQVHFSPVGVMTMYGLPYMIILYVYLIQSVKTAFKILLKRDKFPTIIILCALFVIANFINSFTAYSLFMVVFFSASIGIINNRDIKDEINSIA